MSSICRSHRWMYHALRFIGFLLGVLVIITYHRFIVFNFSNSSNALASTTIITNERVKQPFTHAGTASSPPRQAVYLKVLLPDKSSHSVLRCQLQKISALCHQSQSNGTIFDIYIVLSTDHALDSFARKQIESIVHTYRHTARMIVESSKAQHWPGIGSKRSKFGKSMREYILFTSKENLKLKYAFVWFLEMDILYSGSWSSFFSRANHPDNDWVDLIASQDVAADDWIWKFHAPTGQPCSMLNILCKDVKQYTQFDHFVQTSLPIIRLSTKYAAVLAQLFDRKLLSGHIEFLIGNLW